MGSLGIHTLNKKYFLTDIILNKLFITIFIILIPYKENEHLIYEVTLLLVVMSQNHDILI